MLNSEEGHPWGGQKPFGFTSDVRAMEAWLCRADGVSDGASASLYRRTAKVLVIMRFQHWRQLVGLEVADVALAVSEPAVGALLRRAVEQATELVRKRKYADETESPDVKRYGSAGGSVG